MDDAPILLQLPLPEIILLFVFIAIAVRKVGKIRLPIWLIMSIAAVVVLITRQISLSQAFNAINFNILLYLFGVFIIVGEIP